MKGIEIDFEERCSEEYDRKEKRLMHVGKRIIFSDSLDIISVIYIG